MEERGSGVNLIVWFLDFLFREVGFLKVCLFR